MSSVERVLIYLGLVIAWLAIDFGVWTWRQRRKESWLRELRLKRERERIER